MVSPGSCACGIFVVVHNLNVEAHLNRSILYTEFFSVKNSDPRSARILLPGDGGV